MQYAFPIFIICIIAVISIPCFARIRPFILAWIVACVLCEVIWGLLYWIAALNDPKAMMWFRIALIFGMPPWIIPTSGIVGFIVRVIQFRRRLPRGHCQSCGYNLTGNVSGYCPECGTPT